MTNPENNPAPAPQNWTAPATDAAPVKHGPAPEPPPGPAGPRAPGEEYTKMPDFSSRKPLPRWVYYAAAAAAALILSISVSWILQPQTIGVSTHEAVQPAPADGGGK